jgi:hypothetical protein
LFGLVDRMSLCAIDIAEWARLAESLGLALHFLDGTDASAIHNLASSLLSLQHNVDIHVNDSVRWSLSTHTVSSSQYQS